MGKFAYLIPSLLALIAFSAPSGICSPDRPEKVFKFQTGPGCGSQTEIQVVQMALPEDGAVQLKPCQMIYHSVQDHVELLRTYVCVRWLRDKVPHSCSRGHEIDSHAAVSMSEMSIT